MGQKAKEDLQFGLTLIEMAVVIAVIALLVSLGLPAIRVFFNSFQTEDSTKAMISAALSSARTIAVREHCYAGIRFQKAYRSEGLMDAQQYMIFVIYDPELAHSKPGNLGCKAIEGLKPIKLPEAVGVMDLRYNPNLVSPAGDGIIDSDVEINNPNILIDTTTFSIVFSLSGKMVIHDLWVRNRDGVNDNSSIDDIFNTEINIRDNKVGMFLQDDNSFAGLGIEQSRNSFVIYDTKEFKKALMSSLGWSEYLRGLKAVYINPYTGTIISPD